MKSTGSAGLFGTPLWAMAQARVAQWDWRAKNPRPHQLQTLLTNVSTAADTEFGRAHGFKHIANYEDYKRQVPLRTYGDFEPYLERMRKGERDVLWPGLIPFYGQSSGSSNTNAKNKFLPISKTQIRWQQKGGFDVAARYLVGADDRSYTSGYTLFLFPPARIKRQGPVGVASNPGIMLSHLPLPSLMTALPKPPIRDMENYDAKLTAIAEAYLDYDVRALSGTTCWFSILFDRVLEASAKRGRKVDTVSEIWPNLKTLFGGGVHAAPYRRIIEDRMGREMHLMDNYNATEGGVFASTTDPKDETLMMIPDRGVFFEFVARADHGKPNPKRYALWEVEPNVDYSVVLNTTSGLFGYYIGDFVRFTQTFPHRIMFAGRASGVLSLTQELTSYMELENAFAAATEQHQPCTSIDFAAAPEHGVGKSSKGRYVVFVEFDKNPIDLDAFAKTFDNELCGQNRVYREHRNGDVAILAPRVVALPKGATREFMKRVGMESIQQKFPRIIDEHRRDILLSLAQGSSN